MRSRLVVAVTLVMVWAAMWALVMSMVSLALAALLEDEHPAHGTPVVRHGGPRAIPPRRESASRARAARRRG